MSAADRKVELGVLLSGHRVGALRGLETRRVRFVPDPQWLQGGQRPRLGWTFLVDPRLPADQTLLPAWFENLLPERGSPLRRKICEHHGLHEHDGPALLEVLGQDLPGAVEVQGVVEPDDLDDDEPPRSFAGRLRFSVAGMQPKLSMIRRDDRLLLPAKGEFGDCYVKIAGSQYADLPAVEAATMSWARTVGLEVPEHWLVSIDKLVDVDENFLGKASSAYAIERFDRKGGERIHQEDFAQALNFQPYDKYGGTGRLAVSYDSLARLVADACGDAGRAAFIERVAFMVACGDHDAHLKNWSFQWPADQLRPRLSPCYDLVATVAWPEFGWGAPDEPEMALPFAGSRRFAEIDAARVRTFAARSEAPDAPERFMAALERAKHAWAEQASHAPECMRTALREHWARVPILRLLGGL
ncbi:MAG: HipA domain-containing protein [Enhygromyxa sp.]